MELSSELQNRIEQVAKLPRSARFGIIAGLALAVVAVYFFGFYQDGREQLEKLRAQEQELQRKLSEVRSIASNLPSFEAEIADLEIELAAALRQLPNEKQLEVLLADISNLGKTAGVEIQSFTREPEQVHDFYAEVPIAIEIVGTYHEIARFFDRLSKLQRIVNMGSISMGVESETQETTELIVKGTATTFRFVGQS